MLKEVTKLWSFLEVDEREVKRGGKSYSYETLRELSKKKKDFYFIMGLDQFYQLHKWKNFKEILSLTHLIVTSRPGQNFPKKGTDFPKDLKALIKLPKKYPVKTLSLKDSSKKIYFFQLKDMDISSSDLQKRIKEGKEFSHFLPKVISSYIKEHGLYQKEQDLKTFDKKEKKKQESMETLIRFCEEVLGDKKAFDIESFDLRKRSLPFSYGLMASATNTRQAEALAKHVKKEVKKQFDLNPLHEEGWEEKKWIVFDYGDLVLHIFYDYTKRIYKLNEIWKEIPKKTQKA